MIKVITSTLFLLILTLSIKVSFSQSASVKDERVFYSLCHKANRLMESDLDSAYYCIERAATIAKDNQFWDVYFLKGLIQRRKKEYGNSVTSYKIALSYAKPNLVVYTKTNIANSLYEAGRLGEAKQLASQVVSVDTSNYRYNALGVLAKTYGKLGQIDSSEYFFSEAVKLIPKVHNKNGKVEAGFLVARANMYVNFGKLDMAIGLYKKSLALQQAPYEYCEVHTSLAKCFLLKKDYKEAQRYLRRVFELQKTPSYCHVKALQVKLELEYQLGRYKDMKVTCQALGSLASSTNLDKRLYTEVMNQIQVKLISMANNKDRYVNRVAFVLIMLLPLALLVRMLFRLKKKDYSKSYQGESGQMVVVKNLGDEVVLKRVRNELSELRSNGLLGSDNVS